MLGCTGYAETDDIQMIDDELEVAKWFTLEETRGMFDGSSIYFLPKQNAIAHHLVKSWVMKEKL